MKKKEQFKLDSILSTYEGNDLLQSKELNLKTHLIKKES